MQAAAESSLRHGRLYYGCFFVFAYVLPLSIISVLYGLMLCRLMYGGVSSSSSSAARDGRGGSGGITTKRRVTRLVIIVVSTFAICWLPLQVVFVVQYVAGLNNHGTAFVVVKIIANCLAYTNSCVNPLLYAFLSDAFRQSFHRKLCCVKRQQSAGIQLRLILPAERTPSAEGVMPREQSVDGGCELLFPVRATATVSMENAHMSTKRESYLVPSDHSSVQHIVALSTI